jgi:hypothetical protein
MTNDTQGTTGAISDFGDKSSQMRFELPVPQWVLQDDGSSRRDIWDFKMWFGCINIAMIGVVADNDPRMLTNDGIFNQANKPGAVLFVSAESLDSLSVEARRYLGIALNSKEIPIPATLYEPPKWMPFVGTIEFDHRLFWLRRRNGRVHLDLLLMDATQGGFRPDFLGVRAWNDQ